jgi:uncharacterized protein (TIGR01777 family)
MKKVLITGGTGMIGSALTKQLVNKNYVVIILTRKAKPSSGNIIYKEWSPEEGRIDETAVSEADYTVHLAGANVGDKRWTEKRKKEIVDSRVKSGELLVKSTQNIPNKIKAVVSASAIGWYGPDPQIPNPEPFVESDGADESFLGSTCVRWENAIKPVQDLRKRLVILRTGIVLSNEGGAYPEFKKSFKFRVAAILGNGKQIVSWIHIDDLASLYIHAIENESLNGIYNAVAPGPVSNSQLMQTIGVYQGKKYICIHVPAFALKIALGEMSIEVLKSATVSSAKTEAAGFGFSYPTVNEAIEQLEGS